MDFFSFISDQRQKLNSLEHVESLWSELEEARHDAEIDSNAITQFNNHLPVILDQFWESALEKFDESSLSLDEGDDDFKKYLLVLIYHCLQSHENASMNCVMCICELYIGLLNTREGDGFFKSILYKSVLGMLQTSLDNPNCTNVSLMIRLKKFYNRARLKGADLEITLVTLLHVIFSKSRKVFDSFDTEANDGPISFQALLCLKLLLINETVPARRFLITTFLFNGVRKFNSMLITPQAFSIIQVNFRHLLRDKSIHQKFKDEDFQTFLNAFIHVWKHTDFTYFNEAVLIMNSLKEKYYQILIDILNKILISTTVNKNILKFALAVICNPSKHSDLSKINVTNEILLRNILVNCLSPKSDIANAALESLAEILMSPDMEKEYIIEPFKRLFNVPPGDNSLDTVTILRGLKTLINNKKWGNKSKNKHIFAITLSIIFISEREYPGLFQEMLELLTNEASPFDLKPFLHLLSETYLKTCLNGHSSTSHHLLKILFRMAVHPMASSTEFVKYLYTSMVFPSVCKGVTIKNEYFIDPILSSDFNYAEFFQKCHTLGLIRKDHVAKLIGNLYSIDESHIRLACAIVHLTDFTDLSIIADHIHENFSAIFDSKYLTYLFYIYNKIITNNTSNNLLLHQTLRCNEIMVCFLKEHLMNQTLRWNSVSNAFALLKSLEGSTHLDHDFTLMQRKYDEKLSDALATKNSFLPMFYSSQLVIFTRLSPSDDNINAVVAFLRLCNDERYRQSLEFNPKLWIACLLLYGNICIIKTNLVENGLNLLQHGLNGPINSVKLASLNMMFDLCNLVTHNFEDLIRYMFTQLVYGDSIFKKTCLTKIDRLIRDDYLKLELGQFLLFVSILGDKSYGLSDYFQQLLSENFLISNTTVIAKNFVPLIVHLNGYRKHPLYKLSDSDFKLFEIIRRNSLDRRKIYTLLLTNLPMKARFNIIYAISINILNEMLQDRVKFCEDGFWNMIKDSIFIFKLLSSSANDEDSHQNYYKKVAALIKKYIIEHTEYQEKCIYSEFHKEIEQGTQILLKLLLFNDSEAIQKHIRISAFDAIMHWTDFLMAEIVHLVHVDRVKEIQNNYAKVENFYKKNLQSLRYEEETFEDISESFSSFSAASCSNFDVSRQQIIPDFDF